MTIVLFVAGLLFLIMGAELLVRGASRLAASWGIPPLIIGLTVVAFGTSAPEFAVSFQSALAGQATIAVGNVVGSNIFNILLILGLAALITPLVVSAQLIRFDVPLMIGGSLAVLALAWDGSFSRLDGLLLFAGLLLYLGILIYVGRQEGKASEMGPEVAQAELSEERKEERFAWVRNGLLVVAGLVLLVIGSNWLVDSAIIFAHFLGVSELIIGLTIVAAGTSLPEVVTSIVASLRGERDIAVGNVVGSNIFNLLGVLGVAAMASPNGVEMATSVITFDIPIMIAVAFVCLPIFFTGGTISRWEGALLFGYYIAYVVYLILAASRHDALTVFTDAMIYFVMPLTAITLFTMTANTIRQNRREKSMATNG